MNERTSNLNLEVSPPTVSRGVVSLRASSGLVLVGLLGIGLLLLGGLTG